jgi:hypothetical protein
MKKFTLIIYIFFTSFLVFTQEIPVKNDMIYYSFEHKMNNTKKCIGKYWKDGAYLQLVKRTQDIATAKNKKWSTKSPPYFMSVIHGTGFEDTCLFVNKGIGLNGFSITLPVDYKGTNLLNLGKKKLTSMKIVAKVSIEFTSTNEYKLVAKGFECEIAYSEGNQGRLETIAMEEMYKNNENKSDQLFSDLDYFVRGWDNLILEILEKAIKVDNLD